MTPLEQTKTTSDIIVSWLSLLGVAAAVVFGFSQYRSDVVGQIKDTERTTLSFIARYNQSEILKARSGTQTSIDALNNELEAELQNIRNLNEINVRTDEFFETRAADRLRSDGTYLDAQLIVRFFDEIWVCIDVGLCDRPSAVKFFVDEAYQYHFVLKGEIQRIQRTRPNYGIGLQELRVLEAN